VIAGHQADTAAKQAHTHCRVRIGLLPWSKNERATGADAA